MWVLLVRHEESTKNRDERFAKNDDDDRDFLTPEGKASGVASSEAIVRFAKDSLEAKTIDVVCSGAARAIETAQPIAYKLGTQCEKSDSFSSIVVPETAGLSASELLEFDAEAARQLSLYRSGLFNSYSMRYVERQVKGFECRVLHELNGRLARPADALILVAHRSAITAILMEAARRAGLIPKDFYGYVNLELGSVSLLSWGQVDCDLIFAGLSVDSLGCEGRIYLTSWQESAH